MKYEKIIEGNLIIKKGCKDDFSCVEKITGYLEINSNAELSALKSVGSSLEINSNAELSAPNLESVGGYLYINSNAELSAPNLESVGGYLCINSNAELSALKSVGGYLEINSNAELSALKSVGSSLEINSNAELSAPKAKFNVKGTKEICLKFNFECFLKIGYLFADNILAKIISKKTNKNNTNIYKIQICGHTKASFCIEVDGVYSHGATIKEAKDSLLYKISDRDTSKYKDYTLDTVISFEEAIKMYRCITGACEGGTRHFVENVLKNKKKKYTIKEVIEETKGQYNNDKLRQFFKVA